MFAKRNMKAFVFVEVTILLLLSGCLGATPEGSPTLVPTKALPSPIVQATPTPQPPPPSPAPTPIPLTETPTLASTLSATEREQYIAELLETNAGCQLPCWWGITPGVTTWADAERFFSQIGSKTGIEKKTNEAITYGVGGTDFAERAVRNRFYLTVRDGVVDWIGVDAEASSNPAEFKVAWSAYAPEQMIAKYGQPSRVWVQTTSEARIGEGGAPTGVQYKLWLFYDELGFLIRYGGSVEYKPIYRLCPTIKGNLVPNIEMYLQSPQSQITLEQLVGEKAGLKETIMPLEKATSLSIEAFNALFLQTDQPICFETPRDIWP